VVILLCIGGCTVQEFIGSARDSETFPAATDTPSTETIGSDDSSTADSATTDTEIGTGTDTGADTDSSTDPIRVSFSVSDTATPDYLWVDASTNTVGLQGQWYAFNDSLSTAAVRNEGGGTLCVAGQVAPYVNSGYTYGGIGFNFCNNGPDVEPIYEIHNLGSCPLIPDLAARFIGVSFTISGYPLPGIELQFKDPATLNPPYYPLGSAGSGEYTFAGASISVYDTDAPIEETNSIQFLVNYAPGTAVPYDFCVSNVQVILKP